MCPPGLLGSGDKQATSPLWNYPTMSCFTIRKLSGLQRTDLNWKRKKMFKEFLAMLRVKKDNFQENFLLFALHPGFPSLLSSHSLSPTPLR